MTVSIARISAGVSAFLLLAGVMLGSHSSTSTAQQTGSIIAGAILGQDRSPLAGIEVRAYERVLAEAPLPYRDGEWELRAVGATVKTDERGRYRLDVPPGDYYIRAEDVRPRQISSQPGGPPNPAYPAQFYPAVMDASQASPVRVAAGAAIGGIDLALETGKTGQISGIVDLPIMDLAGIGRADSHYRADIDVRVYPIGLGSNLPQSPFAPLRTTINPVRTSATGTFSLTAVRQGRYRVVASGVLGARRMAAMEDVYLLPGDKLDLTLPLRFAIDLQGRIRVNGPAPSGFQLSALKVDVRNDVSSPLRPAPDINGGFSVSSDGTFVIRNVFPDQQYQVVWPGLADSVQARVSEIRYGNKTVTGDGWIKTSAQISNVQVTFDFGNGRVNLQVEDGGMPRPGAYVLLAPRDRRRMNLHARASTDGGATFNQVAPGVYEAFAFDTVPNGDWRVFESSQAFLNRGRGHLIRVEGGQTAEESISLTKVD